MSPEGATHLPTKTNDLAELRPFRALDSCWGQDPSVMRWAFELLHLWCVWANGMISTFKVPSLYARSFLKNKGKIGSGFHFGGAHSSWVVISCPTF